MGEGTVVACGREPGGGVAGEIDGGLGGGSIPPAGVLPAICWQWLIWCACNWEKLMDLYSCVLGRFGVLALVACAGLATPVMAQDGDGDDAPAPASAPSGGAAAKGGSKAEPPEFPPFAEVSKGLEKVAPASSDSTRSLYTLYKRDRDARLLAELPGDFERQRIFIATTYAGGVPFTGIQLGETYATWKRYDKRLALVEPNTTVRSTGDAESKKTEQRLYTDRVILDVPIVAMGPGGGPVIDMTGLLVGQAEKFFGPGAGRMNRALAKIAKSKAFPQNLEIAFEVPGADGRLQTMHYSISLIPERSGYSPREADPRVGFFTTSYRDISKQDRDTQWVRYINRWWLEKRDPKMRMSPPKQPIVFYIDAAAPVAYRRWIRDGVLEWNKAFERVGIRDAIEVYQQDATTGAHMEKDPEDVRFNFIRWTSSDLGFAIGPSRVHPETGQILDADVVIDDGFIRGWFREYNQLLPEVAMMGFSAEARQWFDNNPRWDPRLRLADPNQREEILRQRQLLRNAASQETANMTRQSALEAGELPVMSLRSGQPLQFGKVGLDPTGFAMTSEQNMACAAMLGRAMDIALFRLGMPGMLGLIEELNTQEEPEGSADEPKDGEKKADEKKDDEKKEEKKKEDLIDGLPESFVGPLMKDLISHEVGHTLGLRHNFKASTWKSIAEINSEDVKGKEPIVASVMDYTPININLNGGKIQGDYAPIGIGPYDMWAIEYGYTMDGGKLKDLLNKSTQPGLAYGTDEDLGGPDALIKQFDLGRDSLDYAENQMRLVQTLRPKIIDRVVKDGESWAKARRAYELLLAQHIAAVRIASFHLGAADVNRHRKGQKDASDPVTPMNVEQQRRALKFLADNAFKDEAFGLTRELLSKMTVDKWADDGGMRDYFADPAYQVHDRILGIQAASLSFILNPVSLQRIYDNELRKAPEVDALTIPELLNTLSKSIWTELDDLDSGSLRKPSISSLRRNLQREYLAGMIDLTLPDGAFTAAYRPIQSMMLVELKELKTKLERAANSGGLDPYTKAHLSECAVRITKALDASYIYNGR
jgi:hypothetical protein